MHAPPQRTRTAGVLVAALAAGCLLATGAPASAATADTVADPPDGWPQFGFQGIVTDKSTALYNPTNEFIFPSVFHAGAHFEDPLGEWYLYYAPHDAPGGISLMYADSLEGPWTEYGANPLITNHWDDFYDVSHISSPDAIWNTSADEMFLYFHGENSTTRYATTDDGVHFTYGDAVVTNAMGGPNVTETSYARVFPHPNPASGNAYGMFYMGNERDDIRRIRLAESPDGVHWTVDPDYVVEPGPEEGRNVSGANLLEWNGQRYVIYHGSSGKSYARTIDATLRDVGETPIVLHEASGIGSDVGRVAAPEVVSDGDDTYLFYESGDRLGATIAWAKEGAEPLPAPLFGDFPRDPQNPVFSSCAAAGSEEFGSAPAWDRIIRGGSDRSSIDGGQLLIPTYVGGVAAAPLLQQELPDGGWEVTTSVSLEATDRFQQAGLLLYSSDTTYAKLDFGRATPGPTVELVYHNEGANRQDSAPPAVAGATRMWLRLTSDGREIRASVSYDGQAFSEYGRSILVEDAEFTHIGPYAFRGGEDAPEITAAFDWLRWSPDAADYAACMSPEEPEPGTTGPGNSAGHSRGRAHQPGWVPPGLRDGWVPPGQRD